MLSIAGVVLAASVVLGQAEQKDNLFNEYGELFVGRWIGEVTLVTDWPGLGKKGEKVIGHTVTRWVADRKGIEDETFAGQGTGRAISFWDPVSKKIKSVGVDSGGTIFEGETWKEGDKWVWHFRGALADGKKTDGKGTVTVKDNGDTLIMEGEGTVGSEPMLPLHDVYRRVSK